MCMRPGYRCSGLHLGECLVDIFRELLGIFLSSLAILHGILQSALASLGRLALADHVEDFEFISAVGESLDQSEAFLHLSADLLFDQTLVGGEEMVELGLGVGAVGEVTVYAKEDMALLDAA